MIGAEKIGAEIEHLADVIKETNRDANKRHFYFLRSEGSVDEAERFKDSLKQEYHEWLRKRK